MERLILARHGESEYSVRGLVNGDATVDVGLTEAGVRQARELGRALADDELDLCLTSALARTRQTAALALAGRAVPMEAWPELNDPRAGSFEGLHLDEYRKWAWTRGSQEEAPGGGESRIAGVHRYADAFRRVLERPEASILVVAHGLPIAYVLSGEPPAARMDVPIEYAHPYRLDAAELEHALAVLEAWCAAPTW
jgi:2,3-bisphosphoglycerate-dependent phosphoglycerate mutase